MSFLRTKEIPPGSGHHYLYLVESYRNGGDPRQRVLEYHGRASGKGSRGERATVEKEARHRVAKIIKALSEPAPKIESKTEVIRDTKGLIGYVAPQENKVKKEKAVKPTIEKTKPAVGEVIVTPAETPKETKKKIVAEKPIIKEATKKIKAEPPKEEIQQEVIAAKPIKQKRVKKVKPTGLTAKEKVSSGIFSGLEEADLIKEQQKTTQVVEETPKKTKKDYTPRQGEIRTFKIAPQPEKPAVTTAPIVAEIKPETKPTKPEPTIKQSQEYKLPPEMNKYVKSIKNTDQKDYAQKYAHYLDTGDKIDEPQRGKLSATDAKEVRREVYKIQHPEEKTTEFYSEPIVANAESVVVNAEPIVVEVKPAARLKEISQRVEELSEKLKSEKTGRPTKATEEIRVKAREELDTLYKESDKLQAQIMGEKPKPMAIPEVKPEPPKKEPSSNINVTKLQRELDTPDQETRLRYGQRFETPEWLDNDEFEYQYLRNVSNPIDIGNINKNTKLSKGTIKINDTEATIYYTKTDEGEVIPLRDATDVKDALIKISKYQSPEPPKEERDDFKKQFTESTLPYDEATKTALEGKAKPEIQEPPVTPKPIKGYISEEAKKRAEDRLQKTLTNVKDGRLDASDAITELKEYEIEPPAELLEAETPEGKKDRLVQEKADKESEKVRSMLSDFIDEDQKSQSIKKIEKVMAGLDYDKYEGLEDIESAIEDYRSVDRSGMTPEEYNDEKASLFEEITSAIESVEAVIDEEEVEVEPEPPKATPVEKIQSNIERKVVQPKGTEPYLRWYTEAGGSLQADAVENIKGKEQVIEVYKDVETGEWKWGVNDRQRGYSNYGIAASEQEAINTAANLWYNPESFKEKTGSPSVKEVEKPAEIPEMKERIYKAMVTDKNTGEKKVIQSSYKNKQDFIEDLRANGYAVDPSRVKDEEEFDRIINKTDAQEWDWKPRKYDLTTNRKVEKPAEKPTVFNTKPVPKPKTDNITEEEKRSKQDAINQVLSGMVTFEELKNYENPRKLIERGLLTEKDIEQAGG